MSGAASALYEGLCERTLQGFLIGLCSCSVSHSCTLSLSPSFTLLLSCPEIEHQSVALAGLEFTM